MKEKILYLVLVLFNSQIVLADICDLTPVIAENILQELGMGSCHNIGSDELGKVEELAVYDRNTTSLNEYDLWDLGGLKHLTLELLKLQKIPNILFDDLYSLKTLNLMRGQFKELPEDMLSGMENLSWFSLYKTEVKQLKSNSFNGNSKLTEIFITQNYELESIDESIFTNLPKLDRVWIIDNNVSRESLERLERKILKSHPNVDLVISF